MSFDSCLMLQLYHIKFSFVSIYARFFRSRFRSLRCPHFWVAKSSFNEETSQVSKIAREAWAGKNSLHMTVVTTTRHESEALIWQWGRVHDFFRMLPRLNYGVPRLTEPTNERKITFLKDSFVRRMTLEMGTFFLNMDSAFNRMTWKTFQCALCVNSDQHSVDAAILFSASILYVICGVVSLEHKRPAREDELYSCYTSQTVCFFQQLVLALQI